MASATITALLTPSLYKVSASAGAFALALAPAPAPGFRTPRAISIGSLQPKSNAKSSATSTTLPTPLRSASFMWGYLPTCQADKIGGRRPSSPIQCSRIDFVNSTEALRWLFVISSVILMLSKNTSIHKSFLVPLLALEAPTDVVSWIRGDYGLWTAFVVFLVRLFYPIPGEMELPLLFVLLVIIAPFQALNVRGTQAGMVISIAIAAFLSYQHLSRSGGLKEAFEQRSIVASIAALFLICVPLCFLIQGFMF